MEDWKKTDDEDLDEEDILLRNKCRKMSDDELTVLFLFGQLMFVKWNYLLIILCIQIGFLCNVMLIN